MKRISILLLVMTIFLVMLSGCGALKGAQTLATYDFETDTVPSVYSIVGERKVVGVETNSSAGVIQKQYTYQSDTVFEDLVAYLQALQDEGWIVTESYDLNVTPGSAQIAIDSADTGKILVLSVAYEGNKYAIKITKTEGTIS